MSGNFTPGPWKQEGWTVIADRKTRRKRAMVAECACAPMLKDHWEADAKLIARAPDMLAALELAALYLGKVVADGLLDDCVLSPKRALDKINVVIAKAKGESHVTEIEV